MSSRKPGSSRARRSQKQPNAATRRRIIARVRERDKWICQLCGHPVDQALTGLQAEGSATIDHVVPFEEGGRYTASNLRLAHMLCNNQRAGHNLDRTLA